MSLVPIAAHLVPRERTLRRKDLYHAWSASLASSVRQGQDSAALAKRVVRPSRRVQIAVSRAPRAPSATPPAYTASSSAERAPKAYVYFTKRGFTNNNMNQLLAWMEDNQADGEEAMFYFLESYPQVWQAWVPQDVAKKVKQAL